MMVGRWGVERVVWWLVLISSRNRLSHHLWVSPPCHDHWVIDASYSSCAAATSKHVPLTLYALVRDPGVQGPPDGYSVYDLARLVPSSLTYLQEMARIRVQLRC